jgi:putative tonB-dependent receptor
VFDYRQTRHDEVRRVIKPMGRLRLLDWEPYWDSNLRNYGLNWQQTAYAGLHELHYGIQYGKMVYEIRNEASKYELPSTGIFVEDDWTLTERTSLGLSLRYDRNQFEANRGALRDKTHTQLSPGVKITQRLGKGQSVYLGARRLFRAPTVADYSRWSTGYIDNANEYRNAFAPTLSHAEWQSLLGVPAPEKGMSYELGWRAKMGDTAVGVTGFYYDIDNFLNIQFKGNLRPPIVYNIDNVKVKGIELTGTHRFDPHWTLSAGYTRQSTSKSGDRFHAPLKGMPESTFNAGLHWDNLRGWQSALDLRYIGSIPTSSDSDYISPYMVADLTVSYAFKSHIINFAVNNLFDRYYEQTPDFRQPGINYNLSYQYTF